jgi:hypothetical protein
MKVRDSELGLGLLEVLMAAGLGTAIIAALSLSLSKSQQASRKISTDLDIVSVKSVIAQSVDCRATFPAPANPPCTVGSNVVLRRTGGGAIVNADESSIFGPWRVRARCEADGVKVFVANQRSDEMNSTLVRDFNHPKAALFAAGATGLCFDRYSAPAGTITCPAGQIMRGINLDTKLPFCQGLSSIVPTCGAGTVLTFDGTNLSCISPSACAWNEVMLGNACTRLNTIIVGGFESLTCEATVSGLGSRNAWGVAAGGTCSPGFAVEVSAAQDLLSSGEPQAGACPTLEVHTTTYLCVRSF